MDGFIAITIFLVILAIILIAGIVFYLYKTGFFKSSSKTATTTVTSTPSTTATASAMQARDVNVSSLDTTKADEQDDEEKNKQKYIELDVMLSKHQNPKKLGNSLGNSNSNLNAISIEAVKTKSNDGPVKSEKNKSNGKQYIGHQVKDQKWYIEKRRGKCNRK